MAKRSPDGLFKRGNFWWGWRRVTLGGPLVRASTKCRDRKAARLVKADWERLAADPAHYAANQTTLAEGIALFLTDAKNRGLAPPTLEMYDSKCRHIARVLGADRPLRSVVATTWDGYVTTREGEGAHSHTIKKELIRGRGILKSAKRRGLYPHDISTVMPDYRARYEPRTRALTMDELQRLGRQLRADRLAHVAFVVATGCRLKESYSACLAHITEWSDGGSRVYIDGTKTRRARRTIPIAPPLEPWLEFVIINAPGTPEGRFFPRWTNARRDILQACERAGIAPCTWNDLRRTNATLLKHAGLSSADVGELLGHVDGRMVETVYGQSTPKSLQMAVRSAFDGTETTHSTPEPRALPAKKADAALLATGLRSRRSQVRILCGAPVNRENEPVSARAESAESTAAHAERYKHDTALTAYPRSAKACETVEVQHGSSVSVPLAGRQDSGLDAAVAESEQARSDGRPFASGRSHVHSKGHAADSAGTRCGIETREVALPPAASSPDFAAAPQVGAGTDTSPAGDREEPAYLLERRDDPVTGEPLFFPVVEQEPTVSHVGFIHDPSGTLARLRESGRVLVLDMQGNPSLEISGQQEEVIDPAIPRAAGLSPMLYALCESYRDVMARREGR